MVSGPPGSSFITVAQSIQFSSAFVYSPTPPSRAGNSDNYDTYYCYHRIHTSSRAAIIPYPTIHPSHLVEFWFFITFYLISSAERVNFFFLPKIGMTVFSLSLQNFLTKKPQTTMLSNRPFIWLSLSSLTHTDTKNSTFQTMSSAKHS